ncbi:MAG: PfkB family carbohydrate kinase [Chloroflexota bacterium]
MSTIAVAVGDNCVDHYLPPIGCDFSGGNAVNVAVHLERAGCPTAYIGAIGDDENGKKLLQDINREGVDTTHVKVYPGQHTACTHIRLSETKERQFVYEDFGPKDVFALDEADIAFIQGHRLVHNTWQGGTEKYLPRFKQSNILVSQDYGERYTPDFVDRTIAYVDVAFFSMPEDAGQDMRQLAEQMKGRGLRLVVVTQGLNGSIAFDGNFYFQPAIPVKVADTLGAGDAFIGAFLANWLDHKEIADCMKVAAQVASQTCTHFGGW